MSSIPNTFAIQRLHTTLIVYFCWEIYLMLNILFYYTGICPFLKNKPLTKVLLCVQYFYSRPMLITLTPFN